MRSLDSLARFTGAFLLITSCALAGCEAGDATSPLPPPADAASDRAASQGDGAIPDGGGGEGGRGDAGTTDSPSDAVADAEPQDAAGGG